ESLPASSSFPRSRIEINRRVRACAVSRITLAEKERTEIQKPVGSRRVVAHLLPATSSTCDCAQGLTARRSRQLRTTQARLPAWLDLPAMPTRSRSRGELPAGVPHPVLPCEREDEHGCEERMRRIPAV